LATENPQTEPEKKSRRFYIILAATILLLALLVGVVLFELSNVGPGPVVIEVTPNKPFYLQGETVSFTIHVNNQQEWPVRYPSTVTYQVEKNSQYIDGDHVEKDCGDPWPKFPAHSKTLYETYQWDQKNRNN